VGWSLPSGQDAPGDAPRRLSHLRATIRRATFAGVESHGASTPGVNARRQRPGKGRRVRSTTAARHGRCLSNVEKSAPGVEGAGAGRVVIRVEAYGVGGPGGGGYLGLLDHESSYALTLEAGLDGKVVQVQASWHVGEVSWIDGPGFPRVQPHRGDDCARCAGDQDAGGRDGP
jgi:hypothetical protein